MSMSMHDSNGSDMVKYSVYALDNRFHLDGHNFHPFN